MVPSVRVQSARAVPHCNDLCFMQPAVRGSSRLLQLARIGSCAVFSAFRIDEPFQARIACGPAAASVCRLQHGAARCLHRSFARGRERARGRAKAKVPANAFALLVRCHCAACLQQQTLVGRIPHAGRAPNKPPCSRFVAAQLAHFCGAVRRRRCWGRVLRGRVDWGDCLAGPELLPDHRFVVCSARSGREAECSV